MRCFESDSNKKVCKKNKYSSKLISLYVTNEHAIFTLKHSSSVKIINKAVRQTTHSRHVCLLCSDLTLKSQEKSAKSNTQSNAIMMIVTYKFSYFLLAYTHSQSSISRNIQRNISVRAWSLPLPLKLHIPANPSFTVRPPTSNRSRVWITSYFRRSYAASEATDDR